MNLPEYYQLFFSNEGTIDVVAKFKTEFDGHVSTYISKYIRKGKIKPEEILKIVSQDGEGFCKKMSFDEHPYEIYKYEIDPLKNKLVIYAKELQ